MVDTTSARALLATAINDNTSGDITAADLRSVFVQTFNAIDLAVNSIGQIAGELTAPGNRTYTIELSAPYTFSITSLVTQTTAGTATLAVQINGTNVTGMSAVAVSTTLTTSPFTGTTSGNVPLNGKVTLVVSNVAGTSELSFAVRYTRT